MYGGVHALQEVEVLLSLIGSEPKRTDKLVGVADEVGTLRVVVGVGSGRTKHIDEADKCIGR